MTESVHHNEVVSLLRKKKLPFLAPDSYNILYGASEKSKKSRGKIAQAMRSKGFTESYPDIILLTPSGDRKYGFLGLELKTEKKYPFRYFRGTEEYWIERSEGQQVEKVLRQASVMSNLIENGGYATFSGCLADSYTIIENYLNGSIDEISEIWEFSYGWDWRSIFKLKKSAICETF